MELSRLTITFLPRHGDGALGEADGDDHRQHFRRQADGHGQGEEERLAFQSCLVSPLIRNTSGTMTAMKRIISQVNSRDALVEAGLRLLPDDGAGHAAQIGLKPGLDDHRGGRAAFDAGAQEADVLQLQRRLDRAFSSASNFSTGNDSPVRLDWMTNRSLQETMPDVGGDHVAGGESDHVAGDEMAQRAVRGAGRREPRWR